MDTKKKRAPIDQLLTAGKEARRMLREKGIESKKSVLDSIMKTEGAPVLPGIPTYLPHQWTLKAAQRIMYDILLLWKNQCGSDIESMENLTKFFTFLIEQLREQEKNYTEDEANMPQLLKSLKEVPVLKDVFSPTRKRETVEAIQRFFVDSFAVAIVLKNNNSTTEYAIWFLDWTQSLYSLWVNPKSRDKIV